MALKTFNIDEKIYKQYSDHCKKSGISMSKQVEKFIESEVESFKSKPNHSSSNSKAEHQQAAHETSPANSHEHTFAKYC